MLWSEKNCGVFMYGDTLTLLRRPSWLRNWKGQPPPALPNGCAEQLPQLGKMTAGAGRAGREPPSPICTAQDWAMPLRVPEQDVRLVLNTQQRCGYTGLL